MNPRFIGRNSVRLAASLAVMAAAAAAGIAPASAATASVPVAYPGNNCGISQADYYRGVTCQGGLLLFYEKNGDGATASLIGDVTNLSDEPVYGYVGSTFELVAYADYVFWGASNNPNQGESQGIRNNVASVSNTSSSQSYTLWVSPGYSGHAETFGPHDYYANLNSQLANNEASMSES